MFSTALGLGLALAVGLFPIKTPGIDQDSDGLDDAWEIANGLDPLAPGPGKLVAWYKLDETNGSVVADSTGHGLTGSFIGKPAVVPGFGRIGGALEFDGFTDGITVAESAPLDQRNKLTVAAWVNPRTWAGQQAIVEKQQAYLFNLKNGRPGFSLQNVTTAGFLRTAAAVPTNAWTHLAATYNGKVVSLYVNGEFSVSMTATGLVGMSSYPLGIGFNPKKHARYFNGRLDDVRLYRRALTAADVRGLYELGADPDGDDLSNFDEYLAGTNPHNPDTDYDFMRDGWEIQNGLDPLANDRYGDPDRDGLINIAEEFLGTDPRNPDTNGNGVPDGMEEGSQNDGATISGTIADAAAQSGPIWVIADTSAAGWSVGYVTALAGPGPYTISGLPLYSNYWVRAWRDYNGNGRKDGYDASGACPTSPVFLVGDRAGLDITLSNLPPTDLWVGNDTAQVQLVYPVVTNPLVKFSARHHHPDGQTAIGYRLEVARDAGFSNVIWRTAGPETATRQWTRIRGSTAEDHVRGLATDGLGNLFTAGMAFGPMAGQSYAGSGDFLLSKSAADGTELWTRLWGTTAFDLATAAAADAGGNVYVAGHTYGTMDGQTSAGGADMVLTKYSADGTRLWTRQWGSSDDDFAFGVAVDAGTNVYVAGYGWASVDGQPHSGGADMVLTRFDAEGVKHWTRQWGSANDDHAYAVATDGAGNVYVAGTTFGAFDGQTNAGSADLALCKFSPAGSRLWTRLWGSADYDDGFGVCVDATGSVFVAGATYGAIDGQTNAGGWDAVLTRFLADGTRQWTRVWGSALDDFAYAAALDAEGNVYVSGETHGSIDGQPSGGGSDAVLAKFSGDGIRQWTRQWGSGSDESARAVVVGSDGKICVAGDTSGAFDGQVPAGATDLFLSKFGTEQGLPLFASAVADGARCPDIGYEGAALTVGATNYWRIGFYDSQTNASPWSATAQNWFVLAVDPGADADGDGLTDFAERNVYGTNPGKTDTDGDGMLDGWEAKYRLDPLANDAGSDPDGDGVANLIEYLQGRNPRKGAVADSGGWVDLQVFTPLE